MKKLLFVLFVLINLFSYGKDSIWNTTSKNPIIVIYKVLDPLIVKVDQPDKIVVPANITNFKYSEYSENKRKLNVIVESPYTGPIDKVLEKIYEKVHFQLESSGNFELIHDKEKNKKIIGKGYFIDGDLATETEKKSYYSKGFSNNLVGNSFKASTQIDVDFNKEKDAPMGVYKGVLKLNVWFDGTI